jgi:hypothetical protein
MLPSALSSQFEDKIKCSGLIIAGEKRRLHHKLFQKPVFEKIKIPIESFLMTSKIRSGFYHLQWKLFYRSDCIIWLIFYLLLIPIDDINEIINNILTGSASK